MPGGPFSCSCTGSGRREVARAECSFTGLGRWGIAFLSRQPLLTVARSRETGERRRMPGGPFSCSCRGSGRREVARAECRSAGPGAVGCRFATKQTFPPRRTLSRRRGAKQFLRRVRAILAAAVRLRATAATGARPLPAFGSRVSTAGTRTRRSAFCPTSWRRGCRGRSARLRRPPRPRRRQRAWRRSGCSDRRCATPRWTKAEDRRSRPHQADRPSEGPVASFGDFGHRKLRFPLPVGHRMGLRQDANPRVSLAAADLSTRTRRHRSWDHSNDKRTLVIRSPDDGRSSQAARPRSLTP